jgi:hypothetical protein
MWKIGTTIAAVLLGKVVTDYVKNYAEDKIEQESRRVALDCLNENSIREVIDRTHPSKEENSRYNKTIDEISQYLYQSDLQYSIDKIKQCGSYSRGTHCNLSEYPTYIGSNNRTNYYNNDLDLVVFVNFGKNNNILKQVTDIISNCELIGDPPIQCVHNMRVSIQSALQEHEGISNIERKDFNMLQIKMNNIWIDLLIVPSDPVFHNPELLLNFVRKFSMTRHSQLYRFLSEAICEKRLEEYKLAPSDAKCMVRLVKYWSDQQRWKKKNKPFSFFLETLMLKVYESYSEEPLHIQFIQFLMAFIKCASGDIVIKEYGTGQRIYPGRSIQQQRSMIQVAEDSLNELYQVYSINL